MHGRMKHYELQRVVVVLADGSLSGIVGHAGRHELELTSPIFHDGNAVKTAPVDGTVVVPYASIIWVQVLS